MTENKKLSIFEGCAFLAGLLAIIMMALPAYVETGNTSLTMFQLVFGNDKTDFNGLLLFGFILLILGTIGSLLLAVSCFLNKYNTDRNVTIMGIASGACILAGGLILSLAIFITGLDKMNSELGFIQGNWGLGAGNILIPILILLGFALSYPAAMIILHHKDLQDKEKSKV